MFSIVVYTSDLTSKRTAVVADLTAVEASAVSE